MASISVKSRTFILMMVVLGAVSIGSGVAQWHTANMVQFVAYLAIALVASGLKVDLPGVSGNMSVNFLFVLLSIQELGLAQALIIGGLSAMVQIFWNPRSKPKMVHVVFNICSMATAIAFAYGTYHVLSGLMHARGALVFAAVAYFFGNTFPVAVIISLTESKPLRNIWKECYFWSFPYYLLGAGISGFVGFLNQHIGWVTSLLVLPSVYVIYRSYRLYLGKLEDEKRHVEEMASLHLRTIEALALAIEAKDHTTHDHLQRVRVYAMEVAKELKISDDEMEALRAAALLHDIGKLAVPEHIINKPGRLTPEEFEKMKIHPVVGAEILEQVKFPYPVAPIVLSHHEKWDGTGYPHGLKGEEIPIGSRILAAVDCLDALASDRQYRRAMALDDAMEAVCERSGKCFDPKVVEVLKRRYKELEKMAQSKASEITHARLSTDMKVARGAAPGAGFEEINGQRSKPVAPASDFLASIASARQEAQMLFELSHDLGSSLSLSETLSLFSARLKRMVQYDAIAVYLKQENELVPEFVTGDNFRLFTSLRIPVGQGLSGWVAQNHKPIINGNPSVEPGYLNDPSKFSTLRSALAVPLTGLNGVAGVLTLYRLEKDDFSQDDLRVLMAISSKLAISVENALKYRMAEDSATVDYLTGLPNARSMFIHLDQEIARCKRTDESMTVMVCDLDGFKQVNDRFGHLEGNRVLRMFADRLKEICREYDYVARMGGDEFVLIIPGLKPAAIQQKIASLVEIAVAVGVEVTGQELLSVSVGHAFYEKINVDAEHLLCEADRSMYVTKKAHHAMLPADGSMVDFRANASLVN
jgi:diguanylate cyclase (GGDEF)-like protein/putative nucleotidyltransferase with HDIG domain